MKRNVTKAEETRRSVKEQQSGPRVGVFEEEKSVLRDERLSLRSVVMIESTDQ